MKEYVVKAIIVPLISCGFEGLMYSLITYVHSQILIIFSQIYKSLIVRWE